MHETIFTKKKEIVTVKYGNKTSCTLIAVNYSCNCNTINRESLYTTT